MKKVYLEKLLKTGTRLAFGPSLKGKAVYIHGSTECRDWDDYAIVLNVVDEAIYVVCCDGINGPCFSWLYLQDFTNGNLNMDVWDRQSYDIRFD